MGYGTSLSFDKHGNKWGLYYATGLASEVGNWTPQRLLTCAKVVRLIAIDYLPELIDALVMRAEQQNRMVASSLAKLNGLLATIEPDLFEITRPERLASAVDETFFVEEEGP
jgi:hypothetical protein